MKVERADVILGYLRASESGRDGEPPVTNHVPPSMRLVTGTRLSRAVLLLYDLVSLIDFQVSEIDAGVLTELNMQITRVLRNADGRREALRAVSPRMSAGSCRNCSFWTEGNSC